MIDATAWVMAEAWLSLGLRIEWASRTFDTIPDTAWNPSESGAPYCYMGHGRWLLRSDRGDNRRRAPMMDAADMRHELAHYLSATPAERELVNFGPAIEDDGERRANEAEKIIDAMLTATARIASLALGVR